MGAAMHDQRRFCARIVNCINHIIKTTGNDQAGKIFFGDKFFHLAHLTAGIDLRNPFCQRSDLGLAQGVGECVDLPIHIGFGQMIQINQRDPADRAARQRLHCP